MLAVRFPPLAKGRAHTRRAGRGGVDMARPSAPAVGESRGVDPASPRTQKARAGGGGGAYARRLKTALGLCLLGLAVTAPGCDRGGPMSAGSHPTTTANQKPLRIAAASDLQHALPRLAERFQQRTGTMSSLTLDASGRLSEQIKAGAPFDVFLAANVKFVSDLAAAALVLPESVQPYARGALVLCVHRSASSQVLGLDDLSRPAIKKIAIANPDYAPYGFAARQALQRGAMVEPWAEDRAGRFGAPGPDLREQRRR